MLRYKIIFLYDSLKSTYGNGTQWVSASVTCRCILIELLGVYVWSCDARIHGECSSRSSRPTSFILRQAPKKAIRARSTHAAIRGRMPMSPDGLNSAARRRTRLPGYAPATSAAPAERTTRPWKRRRRNANIPTDVNRLEQREIALRSDPLDWKRAS